MNTDTKPQAGVLSDEALNDLILGLKHHKTLEGCRDYVRATIAALTSGASQPEPADPTPGPWVPFRTIGRKLWRVKRDVPGGIELMEKPSGVVARFWTEDAARAAIAKATGSTT